MLLVAALGGCFGPARVELADIRTDQTRQFEAPTALPTALAYAHGVRESYRDRISLQMGASRALGLAAIGALAGLSYVATQGGSQDVAYALGIGAGGSIAANQLLVSDHEQFIYAAGAAAVTCAIDAAQTMQATGPLVRPTLVDAALGERALDVQAARLSVRVEKLAAVISDSPQAIRGRAAVIAAREAADRARAALLQLDSAGDDLVYAVDLIQSSVDRELVKSQPDLAIFVGALSSQLATFAPPARASAATPRARTETSQPGASEVLALAASLEARTADVVDAASRVEAAVRLGSSEECQFNPEQLSRTLQLQPSTHQAVAIDPRDLRPIEVRYIVSGGRPPYRFAWIGPVPPGGVEPVLESGDGRLDVTVLGAARSGSYAFRIVDASGVAVDGTLAIANPND